MSTYKTEAQFLQVGDILVFGKPDNLYCETVIDRYKSTSEDITIETDGDYGLNAWDFNRFTELTVVK